MPDSPFLDRPESDWVASNALAFALRDAYPVSPGHTLIIPRRLVPTWFEATRDEQLALLELLDVVKAELDRTHQPAGYNIGVNAGPVAGQTVRHLHVHLIPRYPGDVPDPRGGVRGVIPHKQRYDALPSEPPARPPHAGDLARDRGALGYTTPSELSPFAALPDFVPGTHEGPQLLRPLRDAIARAQAIDIVAAFVQPSGLDLIRPELEDALERQTQLRILTGDYLGITSADALRALYELAAEHPRLCAVKVYQVPAGESFHPKAYVFVRGEHGVAYVGSSNLTRTALTHGIEWNLRLVTTEGAEDRAAFRALRGSFERLWRAPHSQPLTHAWIDAYAARAPVPAAPVPEPRPPAPEPHDVQRAALDKLAATRADGKTAGLVVLATGLGKTYLSAFDFKAMGGRRALFIAHREEILEQARQAWARVFSDLVLARLGRETSDAYESGADVLFASVQLLSRERHHTRFAPDHFDYIVVDEFHHAAASTYRGLLTYFRPRFLLGLTATPDRMDGASLLELCGGNLVHREDLIAGITRKLLVPFRYFGVKDRLDFTPIPWRSGRFDPEALTQAVETESRAEQALEAYQRHAPTTPRRTLVFCVSQTHADYMAAFFRRQGLRAAAVHSGQTSAPRAESLRKLEDGSLELICAVDIFNEGLDVPAINTVLMLRPTASPVIFLQQIGRGLRPATGKSALVVIDFIGNHRTFLQRPQALVYLTGRDATGYESVRLVAEGKLELPEGCSVEIETEALDMLGALARQRAEDTLVYEYGLLRDTHGRRPSATELLRALGTFGAVKRYSSYFEFVGEQNDLSPEEARVLDRHRPWFRNLTKTRMSKSFKMVALEAMLDAGALPGEITVRESAERSNALIRQSLLLYREMVDGSPQRAEFDDGFVKRWREMPLGVWARGEDKGERWFRLEGDRFRTEMVVAPEDVETFAAMSAELVELRLAEHVDGLRRKQPTSALEPPIVLKVSHSGGRPILRFDRARQPGVPGPGLVEVEVDGERYVFHFVKIAVNKVVRAGEDANVLPSLMRKWFGITAGHPGTGRSVVLEKLDRGYRLRPDGEVAPSVRAECDDGGEVPFFEDLQVACGALDLEDRLDGATRWIRPAGAVQVDPSRHFVVRASGDSMDGGAQPIKDGDLVLCEWFDGRSAEEVEGVPTLLMGVRGKERSFAALKVPRRVGGVWELESANPSFAPEPIPAGVRLEPVARVVDVVEEPTVRRS